MKAILHPRRNWSHKSVRALMEAANDEDPVRIIRTKCREIVTWAKRIGWTGPPFNPLELASLRGIRSQQSEALFSAEAQLTPMEGNQLLLEFNPNRPPGRQNYSISHELVHTLFDDCFDMVHQRRSDRSGFDPEQEVEYLCQIGAAEFLMPAEEFRKDIAAGPFSLKRVPYLSDRYGASREAVARRMVDLGGWPAALVFLSNRLKPVEIRAGGAAAPRMRILYSVQSKFPVYLPEHKSVPDYSTVYRAKVVDEVVSGFEEWEISGFGRRYVEAMALPGAECGIQEGPAVMALISGDIR